MSADKINIFLTGATGYIGGSVLNALLHHPNAANFNITALIRGDDERVQKLASLNVTPLVGSNESFEILEKAASESDVVIHSAESAFDLPSAQAIISGLNKRTKATGKPAIYIHNSGGCLSISEDLRDKTGSDKVYSDLDPVEQSSNHVDQFIANAEDANPLLKTVVLLSPRIYGIGTGLFNRNSIQLPRLIEAALKRHQAGMMGIGAGIWNNVHIADVCDAYVIIFDHLLAAYGPDAKSDAKPPNPYLTTGREGYYFIENGSNTWRQLSEKIGEVLYKKGLVQSPEVTSFSDDEVAQSCLGIYSWDILGSQSNCKAERIRKLGWNPHRPSLLDSVEEQVDVLINNIKD